MGTVSIRGKQYTVSPLSLGSLRDLTKEGHLAAITSGFGGTMDLPQVEATVALVSASLSREHPECNRDWVADNLDVQEAVGCLAAVLIAAGFVSGGSGPNAPSP